MSVLDTLSEIRKHEFRKPYLVERMILKLIGDGEINKYDESTAHILREQLIIATLDTGNDAIRDKTLEVLVNRFPSSQRIEYLKGLVNESKNKMDDASSIYSSMITINPANTIASKRQIAILIENGKIQEAITSLHSFIRDNMGDEEAWRELAGLYLLYGQYDSASYCYEDLILIQPYFYANHIIYGECLFSSIGGSNNHNSKKDVQNIIVQARKHFSHSLMLKRESNVRALWGLIRCCYADISLSSPSATVTASAASSSSSKKKNEKTVIDNNNDDSDTTSIQQHEAKLLTKDLAIFAGDNIILSYRQGNAPPLIVDIITRIVDRLKNDIIKHCSE